MTLAPAAAARPLVVETVTPWMVVGLLLAACCAKGLWATIGVEVPPDPDTVRDLGFIQGFLDGNWFGDPAIAGAWRWYPPLLHGVAALVVGGLRLPLFAVWLHAGAVLNLLSPLTFYLMHRRLIGAWPAVVATAVFVLFDSVVMPSDATAGYTPWTLTPALVWPAFFGSVWLIADRVQRLRMVDAALIGTALGLVFLAHTVPAVLLSGITVAAALATHGRGRRTWIWLALVAGVELAWAAPFLLPLVAAYHLHIANLGPGAWVHPALSDPATIVPNAFGVLASGWLLIRREQLPRGSAAILAAWIGLCVLFLGRHYACAGRIDGVCGVFVVAAHHYHVYLQAAWASVGGVVLARLWVRGRRQDLVPLTILAGFVGLLGFFSKADDIEFRRLGSTRPELILDRAAYDWIIARTQPGDLFVTALPVEGADMGPAAATVMAAGRRLVAPPAFHTHPYVAWAPMNARRASFLTDRADLCPLLHQAGSGTAFFLVPEGHDVPGTAPVFSSAFNTIYRLDTVACASTESSEDLVQRLKLVAGG
jgi:hypothetical protein